MIRMLITTAVSLLVWWWLVDGTFTNTWLTWRKCLLWSWGGLVVSVGIDLVALRIVGHNFPYWYWWFGADAIRVFVILFYMVGFRHRRNEKKQSL